MPRLDMARIFLATTLMAITVYCPINDLRADQNQWQGNGKGKVSSEPADFRVARSLGEWTRVWKILQRPAPPDFNEGRDMAVIIEADRRPSAGYAVDILGAEQKGLFLVIRWRDRNPAPEAYVAQVVTYPWSVKKLDKADIPVIFLKAGDTTYAIPRREYFRFKAGSPNCAAGLERQGVPEASVYYFASDVIAPLLSKNRPACANY